MVEINFLSQNLEQRDFLNPKSIVPFLAYFWQELITTNIIYQLKIF